MKQALIVLAKYPRPGKVKTRLAAEFGTENAAYFYKQLLENLLLKLDNLKNTKIFFLTPNDDQSLFEKWLGKKFILLKPFSKDIEQNLNHAFSTLFKQGFNKIVSIASDVPDLTTEIIQKSFFKLNEFEVVIGPDTGGGIYLYGETLHHAELFQGEYREGTSIFDETIRKIKNKKLTFFVFEKLIDIDTINDLNKWKISIEPI